MKQKMRDALGEAVLFVREIFRPLARPRPIPSQHRPDMTGSGWGRTFQQAIEDIEASKPASIEIMRSQYATGDQRWTAMLWDGDESEVPSVLADGTNPADALLTASRKYRERALMNGTVVKWRTR